MGGYPSGGGARNIEKYKTILSANIGSATADTDNTYHVIFCYMSAPGTEVNGLYITGGYANGAGDNANGGGVYLKGFNSAPGLFGCVIANNQTPGDGAGIFQLHDGRVYNGT